MTNPDITAAPPATFPGKGLGIAGLILAIFAAPIGLILSVVAGRQSKKAGYANGPAKAGLIIGIILTVIWIIVMIVMFSLGAALFGGLWQACAELGPGTHTVDGLVYTCG